MQVSQASRGRIRLIAATLIQSDRYSRKRLSLMPDGCPQNYFDRMDIRNDGGCLIPKETNGPAYTYNQVPAGIFLPTIGIGACLGRAMGLIMYVLSCFS